MDDTTRQLAIEAITPTIAELQFADDAREIAEAVVRILDDDSLSRDALWRQVDRQWSSRYRADLTRLQAERDQAEQELTERAEQITDPCRHDSCTGDEGPADALPYGIVVRWRCDGCGAVIYDDTQIALLREKLLPTLTRWPGV